MFQVQQLITKFEYKYGKTPKRVGATFSFSYITSSKVHLTASADTNYVLSIPGAPFQPPLVIGVKTAEAEVTHTIGS